MKKQQSKTEWEITNRRYIGFLDLMGFKDYVYRNAHKSVEKRMRILSDIITNFGKHQVLHIPSENSNDTLSKETIIRSVLFSDTIFIFSKDSSDESFRHISAAVSNIIYNSLLHGMGIKGAISYGMITADFEKTLYCGKAIVDAYQLQEEVMFYGCLLDHSVEKKLAALAEKQNIIPNYAGIIKTGKAPLKSGRITHQVIDIFSTHENTSERLIKSLYKTVSGRPRIYVDNTESIFKELEPIEKERKEQDKEREMKIASLLIGPQKNQTNPE